uniref:Ataxin-2 C-terminal domain-containing protein n=1 Tax=Glossina brevipalpis TaxID=37001 RepID=A0A1A9WND1_9MUSC
MRVPSNNWYDQFEQYVMEEESDNDLDDEEDFSEYLWMENEEEFDKLELKRLEEEELMKECIDAMLEDELEMQLCEFQKARNDELNAALSTLSINSRKTLAINSLLNPLAAEFIPRSRFFPFRNLLLTFAELFIMLLAISTMNRPTLLFFMAFWVDLVMPVDLISYQS